ncbi:MFS transporter [Aurantibacter sp.]|uniref:MFS transporter n=1 Tax=Aurantibacter sp. TaxID=2807103 RepID=UPI0035C7E115
MKEQLRVLKVIHFALCAGLIIGYYLLSGLKSISDLLIFLKITSGNIIYIFIPIVAFIISNLIFKQKLKVISPSSTEQQKIIEYQSASIIRWAILEGSAFALLILQKDFILFGILIIIYLIMIRPTEDKVKNELKLH